MSYKLAVGSSDGEFVDQHFGRSERFYIYEVSDDGEWSLLEVRENATTRAEGEHQTGELSQTIELLKDCSKVLVLQIGPGAQANLKQLGIMVYSSRGTVEDALAKLIAFESKRKNRAFLGREQAE
ncbi:putative Fe-Mo cluster-binding NifX family protein [Paenibacillus forsythiae]|uniref:Fe-Mo cluster-binding NifX family protein n=1 Tax=Paenibacillus forsythiae TaxID=365616 RepID=A0ABU3H7E0_9BACL|nr:NifB/NifX family molybdenum-iron cluster-binding protein [Paenibacillus forsythiae]MDT3426748.1 putative Fe-Mo cluster-binding NifX family protein [Paenibacillus forsythiae]